MANSETTFKDVRMIYIGEEESKSIPLLREVLDGNRHGVYRQYQSMWNKEDCPG